MAGPPSYVTAEELERFTPEALTILEGLGEHVRGFHDGPYFLPDDSPLPVWFLDAVRGVKNRGIEGGWPQFARYWDPVDWLTLAREHPEGIRFECPEDKQLFTDLSEWSRAENLELVFDVGLFINVDATIGIDVWTLCYKERPAPFQQSQIKAAVTSHGFCGYWQEGAYAITGKACCP